MDDLGKLRFVWDHFLDEIRDNKFDLNAAEDAICKIESIDCDKYFIEKEIVSNLWMIPIFMEWNRQRCIENGANQLLYGRVVDRITEIIIEKLGIPS